MTAAVQPTRGTRPRNRRSLILDAASALFATRGYEHVNMSDVAAAVAVGPSALYRHFAKKEALLAEVVNRTAIRLGETLTAMTDPEQLAEAITTYSLDHREAGMLWEREARHLSPDAYAVARGQLRTVSDQLTSLLAQQFPGFDSAQYRLAAAVTVALAQSVSFHGVHVPRPAFDHVLTAMIDRATQVALHADLTPAGSGGPSGLTPRSRTTQITVAALRLFSTHTYASVSLEDIAAEVGIAPSGLYNHFSSKADILATAQRRANGYLQTRLADILAGHDEPHDALVAAVRDYAEFAYQHPHNTHTLITDQRNLAPEDRSQFVRDQRDYQAEWAHLVGQLHPEMSAGEALVAVQTSTVGLAFLALNPQLRRGRNGANILSSIALAGLGLDAA